MNKTRILFCIILLFTLSGAMLARADVVIDVRVSNLNSTLNYYGSLGYSCIRTDGHFRIPATWIFTCTKAIWYSYLSSYGATQNDYRTLTGYANYNSSSYVDTVTLDAHNTPFLYLQNPPEGEISVHLDSELNNYYPKPQFNQENGWLVESEEDTLSVNREEQEHLFYELELSKLTLNRNGKNFSSKDEIVEYLEHSDFLTKLGFSDIEKKNSLEYFIPKLQESQEQNYYYLTILSDTAVSEISELHINPEPKDIIRQYFAVYPTPVPVKTVGEFIFPEYIVTSNDFTAKETGELLVHESMQVFFE